MSNIKFTTEELLKKVQSLLEKALVQIASVVFIDDEKNLNQFKTSNKNLSISKLESKLSTLSTLNQKKIRSLSRLKIEKFKHLHQLSNKLNTKDDVATLALNQIDEPSSIEIDAYITQLAIEINKIIAPKSSINCKEELNLAFLNLIDLVVVSPKLSTLKKSLRAQIIEDEDLSTVKVISEIANLIQQSIAIVQQEKQGLEKFIQNIKIQVQEFVSFIDVVNADSVSSQSNNTVLEDALDKEMSGIKQDIDNSKDIDGLKTTINGHIDMIKGKFTEFKNIEQDRFNQTQLSSKELSKKVKSLEMESSALKQELDEQRQYLMIDALTGVPGRFAYEAKIVEEYSRWERYHQGLSFIIFDIDLFKKVNDNHGHITGDRALRSVAKTIINEKRETDFFARIGGEEFVMLLPNTNSENAEIAAEKIRIAVENIQFTHKSEKIKLTISSGVTSYNKDDTNLSVYERADKALYQAKHNGRNRVVTL